MRDLTEQEKTVSELFKTNGRPGVHQYFVNTLDMSDDDTETAIDKLDYLPIDSNLDNFEKQGFVPMSTTTETVTFADGSQKEIQVAADGTVVTPEFANDEDKKSFLDKLKEAVGLE